MALLAPFGDGFKDDFYRGRSQLNEFYIANHLSLNSLALGFEKIFCFLQLPDQLFDLRNRWSANLLNKWRGMRFSFGLGREVTEIAISASGFHNTLAVSAPTRRCVATGRDFVTTPTVPERSP